MNRFQKFAFNFNLRHYTEAQAEVLFSVYRYNMEVVNFWLNYLVLPSETMQYPERMQVSAWWGGASQQYQNPS
jgi:hypothetical protein